MAKLNKYGKPWKTFQQWKRQHPKGTRKQYNAYRARQRTAGGAMSQPAMAPLTNQQLQLLATQMAQADLLPQQQALDRERQRALEQAKNQQSLIAGLTAATGGIVGQIAPTIDDAYRQAAQDQAGFAQGFAGDMQQIAEQQAAQNAADLSKWGAPAQQIANVEAAGQGAQDVLYGTQGYLPATTLGQQGAAMTAFGAQMPGIVTRMGQEDQRLVAYEAQQQARGFADQAAELASRLPGLRRQYIQDLLQQEQDKVALSMALKRLGLDGRGQALDERLGVGNLTGIDPVTGLPTLDAQAAAADAQADAADARADARAERNKNRRKYRENIGKGIVSAYGRIDTGGTSTVSFGSAPSTATGGKKPTFKQAMASIYSDLKAQYGTARGGWRYGITDKAVRQMIRRFLAGKGIRPVSSPSGPIGQITPPGGDAVDAIFPGAYG
jgi:hypothetical protein